MRIEVVIPWAPGCPDRGRALDWVLARYARQHPSWTVTVAQGPSGRWVKGSAVNPAIAASVADVVIVADADCWTAGLERAVDAIDAGAPWAVPHDYVHRLTEQATDAVLAGADPHPRLEHAQRPYTGIEGGGFVVARRQTLTEVPYDPRFEGWGQEDNSLGMALHTLAGPRWRGNTPLFHLYHPAPERIDRKRGNPAGWALYRRYAKARRDPAEMRALLAEAGGGLELGERAAQVC